MFLIRFCTSLLESVKYFAPNEDSRYISKMRCTFYSIVNLIRK